MKIQKRFSILSLRVVVFMMFIFTLCSPPVSSEEKRRETLYAGKSSPASCLITLSNIKGGNNSAKLHFYYGGESQTNYKRNLIRFIFLDQNQEEIRSESFLYDSPSTWGGLKFVEKEMTVDFSPEEIAEVKYLQLYVKAGDYQSAMRYYKEELETPFISFEEN